MKYQDMDFNPHQEIEEKVYEIHDHYSQDTLALRDEEHSKRKNIFLIL